MVFAPRRAHLRTRIAVGLILTVLATLLSVVSTNTPAHAHPGAEIIGDPNTGGGTAPGSGGGPSGGGGSSGGGGGSNSGGWIAPNAGYYVVNYIWSVQSPPVPARLPAPGSAADNQFAVRASYNGQCRRNTRWGPYIGVKTVEAGTFLIELGAVQQYTSEYSCIDPPHYTDYQVMCGYDVGAEVWGPRKNGYNPAVPYGLFHSEKHMTPFVRGGMTDMQLCQQSFTVQVRKKLTVFGQWELRALGRQIPCTWRDYYTADARTGRVPADRFIGCDTSRARPYSAQNPRLQLFCPPPYHTPDWSGSWKFSLEECLTQRSPQTQVWQCGPETQQMPRFDGATSPNGRFQVLADGKNRLAEWNTVTLRGGVRNVTGKKVRFEFMTVQSGPEKGARGTPYNEKESHQSERQYYVAEPGLHTQYWDGWSGAKNAPAGKTGFTIAFQKAGQPDRPFTVRPVWHFDAEFLVKVVEIKSVNWSTGKYTYEVVDQWVKGNAKCYGQPLQIDVFRARNSNQ